jgi:hypothetical protein
MQGAIGAGDAADDQRVQDAVCDLVDVLKAAGWPVEAIIVLVKQTAADVGLTARGHGVISTARPTPAKQVLEDAVRLCIEHYYKDQ